jgi:hypothetical protein
MIFSAINGSIKSYSPPLPNAASRIKKKPMAKAIINIHFWNTDLKLK